MFNSYISRIHLYFLFIFFVSKKKINKFTLVNETRRVRTNKFQENYNFSCFFTRVFFTFVVSKINN